MLRAYLSVVVPSLKAVLTRFCIQLFILLFILDFFLRTVHLPSIYGTLHSLLPILRYLKMMHRGIGLV